MTRAEKRILNYVQSHPGQWAPEIIAAVKCRATTLQRIAATGHIQWRWNPVHGDGYFWGGSPLREFDSLTGL